ncbi:hypothetical protein [Anaerosporobacter faecicola]|uniref:hypothetical protein n=1 Tax=Anaerosporobacter faecicola TaxID=2718714 RepID=UPI00143C75C8|nr:hypothetical protein [Anaerosporobacter faecicola]
MTRILTEKIAQQTDLLFRNMEIAMKTCDWECLICGAPTWRYIYHTLHSCDKWFCNPNVYTEPAIHVEHLDQVDIPCSKVLSEEELWSYFHFVKEKVEDYLAVLSDQQLSEHPEKCEYTVLELILGQYRHFMCHIGILNGMTIANTGRYPMVLGLDEWKANTLDGKLFDE